MVLDFPLPTLVMPGSPARTAMAPAVVRHSRLLRQLARNVRLLFPVSGVVVDVDRLETHEVAIAPHDGAALERQA